MSEWTASFLFKHQATYYGNRPSQGLTSPHEDLKAGHLLDCYWCSNRLQTQPGLFARFALTTGRLFPHVSLLVTRRLEALNQFTREITKTERSRTPLTKATHRLVEFMLLWPKLSSRYPGSKIPGWFSAGEQGRCKWQEMYLFLVEIGSLLKEHVQSQGTGATWWEPIGPPVPSIDGKGNVPFLLMQPKYHLPGQIHSPLCTRYFILYIFFFFLNHNVQGHISVVFTHHLLLKTLSYIFD